MYRIELAPGEETVFRTIEELAIGVRNGLVTPRCRIYHNATQKWLPIEFHPHYKQALALPASRAVETAPSRAAAPKPASRLPRLFERASEAAKVVGAPKDAAFAAAPNLEAPKHEARKPGPAEIEPRNDKPLKIEQSGEAVLTIERPKVEPGTAATPVLEGAAEPKPSAEERIATLLAAKEQAERSTAIARETPPPAAELLAGSGGSSAVEPAAANAYLAEHDEPEHLPWPQPIAQMPTDAHMPARRAGGEPAAPDRIAARRPAATAHPRINPAPTAAPDHGLPAPPRTGGYRPDSYLPPSVRLIADDPSVAIAPDAPPSAQVESSPGAALSDSAPISPTSVPWASGLGTAAVVVEPKISYPEITPAEEPVAERTASGRGRRPLQVAIAVLVLAAGGYLAKALYSPVAHHTQATEVARPQLPADSVPVVGGRAAPAAQPGSGAPTTTSASTGNTAPPASPSAAAAPASSGFAAALESRAIVQGPAPRQPQGAGAPSPGGTAADSSVAAAPITPAPAEMPLDVPSLPGAPVLATPTGGGDSAMKRILRAVNGGKDTR